MVKPTNPPIGAAASLEDSGARAPLGSLLRHNVTRLSSLGGLPFVGPSVAVLERPIKDATRLLDRKTVSAAETMTAAHSLRLRRGGVWLSRASRSADLLGPHRRGGETRRYPRPARSL